LEWARQAQQIERSQMPGWRARDVERVLAWALTTIGDYADLPDALALCEHALARARAVGDLGAEAHVVFLLEVLAFKTGRLPQAKVYLREAAELATRLGSTLRLIDILDECGYLCVATGQFVEAVTLWAAMVAHNQASGIADTLEGEHRRDQPLRDAKSALGARQLRTAEERGAAMTLAAAVEFAMMTAGDDQQASVVTGALSARERELVALVAQGRTDAEIAEKLFISVSTVRTHLDRIRDKSGCRRRADLTRLALQEGII
jgi:DNA-binding CsgD family transcriptional regulator